VCVNVLKDSEPQAQEPRFMEMISHERIFVFSKGPDIKKLESLYNRSAGDDEMREQVSYARALHAAHVLWPAAAG
jgi:hypothetical protein